MTREEALKAWEKMYSEIDKENYLFVGTINPQMVEWAIKALGGKQDEDLISRQTAIDTLNKLDVSDGVGISSIACSVQESAISAIQHLPSAQPELIRCKNCKHNQLPSTSGNANCEIFYGMTDQDGFCHMAERRTDDSISD